AIDRERARRGEHHHETGAGAARLGALLGDDARGIVARADEELLALLAHGEDRAARGLEGLTAVEDLVGAGDDGPVSDHAIAGVLRGGGLAALGIAARDEEHGEAESAHAASVAALRPARQRDCARPSFRWSVRASRSSSSSSANASAARWRRSATSSFRVSR